MRKAVLCNKVYGYMICLLYEYVWVMDVFTVYREAGGLSADRWLGTDSSPQGSDQLA